MTTVADEAASLRGRAEKGPIGKRASSFALYALLADCMALALRCRAVPEDRQALIELLKPAGYGKGRCRKGQVNANSSTYQLVCRFVFTHGTSQKAVTSNASRYGKTLEEAAKRGIPPAKLEAFLRSEGGVNALYQARPVKARTVTTKALRLTESITVPRSGRFTLTLERNVDGSFNVVAHELEKAA